MCIHMPIHAPKIYQGGSLSPPQNMFFIWFSSYRLPPTLLPGNFPQFLSGKESTCNAGDAGSIPGSRKILLKKEVATHSSTLAWEIPRREDPGKLQSMRPQKSQI